MDKKIFSIEEIITIVMEEIKCRETEELYGVYEEADIPFTIKNKINTLDSNDYETFMKTIEEITLETYELKSGELNELNKCHEEIMILAENELKEFIYK